MKKLLVLFVLVFVLIFGNSVMAAVYLGTSIRSLDNPYHATWNEGGELYAEEINGVHRVLLCEGSDEKQLDDIKALLATVGTDVVFNIDPNQSPNVTPIVELLEERGVYYVTNWNKPEEMHPWDYKYWVAHIGYGTVAAGYQTAVELFEAMGGEGKIVAIEGMLANTASIERVEGLEKALEEYPDIEMLDHQPANWSRTEAFDLVQNLLLAYPDINGVWAANDSMAMGVIEALRTQGLAGQVKVTGVDGIGEAFEAIRSGDLVATAVNNAHWQGGIGLAMAYKAYTGEINPSELPKNKREYFYDASIVTQDNLDEYLETYVNNVPEYDFDNIWPDDKQPAIK